MKKIINWLLKFFDNSSIIDMEDCRKEMREMAVLFKPRKLTFSEKFTNNYESESSKEGRRYLVGKAIYEGEKILKGTSDDESELVFYRTKNNNIRFKSKK
jgi:hypothetical protein